MSFLAVTKRTVVDQPFVAAQPEVLDEDGVTVITPAVPEQPLITHEEVDRPYIEDDAATVARNLEADAQGSGPGIDYYHLSFNGPALNASIQPVVLKAGPRASAPAREIVEIEAGGQDVGSAIVEV